MPSKQHLLKQVEKFKGARVAILGDLMLDEHLWCEVSRISPEAPVPVARVTSVTHEPGGAANVAHNVVDLGGMPFLFGTVGQDGSGEKLCEILKTRGIGTDCIIRAKHRPTTLKSRVIAHHQHVVRVDREKTEPIKPETHQHVLAMFRTLLPQLGAVLVSDYHKGFLTDQLTRDVIRIARKAKIPVLVDPKGTQWHKYKHATVITPNRSEAEAVAKNKLSDEKTLSVAATKLVKAYDLDYLLITRSEQGMTLFPSARRPLHIDAIAQEVFDITGAGDTVIGTLAVALAQRCPIKDAMVLANVAASIVVTKVGTATATTAELQRQLKKINPKFLEVKTW